VGLGFLGFAPGDEPVSVPPGAHAGDLGLSPCTYAAEGATYVADCGTLVVPENRSDPGSRLIALPVTRIRAISVDAGLPIFRLQGGPGLSNMDFPQAGRFLGHHDVVLVGYRGVDGSVRLDCPEVVQALKESADLLGPASLKAYGAALASCAGRLRKAGVDLAGYSISQRTDDLEAARTALGYPQVDLFSESAGTRTAMIYAWRHPASIGRSVMLAVNPPGHFMDDPARNDEQLLRYSTLCAADSTCTARTSDLAASIRSTARSIPDHWLFLPIKAGNVLAGSWFGLADSVPEAAPLSAPIVLDSWISAANGDPSGFWFLSLMAGLVFPNAFVWGEMAATGIQDAPVVDAYYAAGGDPGTILGNPSTDFLWGGGALAHAWPFNPADALYAHVQSSDVETLLVGGTVDMATPPKSATAELLPSLSRGHQVVLAEFGHTKDFWTLQPEASTRLLTAFYDTGSVDDSLYVHRQMDFVPKVTQTALAKGFVGTMLGLGALALAMLVWMPWRVFRRGRFGSKSRAALRTLGPVVLGFGGWFAATLAVMAVAPTVPLDNGVVGVLSVSVPIGLGIYWAWVDRDWSTRDRTTGFWLAMGAALVGGWFGFTSTAGLLALITTIVGAAIAANLALIALDISWEKGRERIPAAAPLPR
jgi:pimeloyl-ACP methyl ester carboxylesterase